jgi:hypothetical protein
VAPKVSVKVELDTTSVLGQLKTLSERFRSTATEINQSLELVSKAWNFASSAVTTAAETIADWTKSAMEAEASERHLATALKLRGEASASALASTKLLNNALQQKLGIDADNIAQTQGMLLSLGIMPSRLDDATRATLGLSEATGKSLTASAKQVIKAFKQGKEDSLIPLFELAEARAETLEAKLGAVRANFGDLGETLGGVVTQNRAVNEAAERLRATLENLNSEVQAHHGALDQVATKTAEAASTLDALFLITKKVAEQEADRQATMEKMTGGGTQGGVLNGLIDLYERLAKSIRDVGDEIQEADSNAKKGRDLAALVNSLGQVAQGDATEVDLEHGKGKKVSLTDIKRGLGIHAKQAKHKAPNPLDSLSATAQDMLREGEGSSQTMRDAAEVQIEEEKKHADALQEVRDEADLIQLEREKEAAARLREFRQEQLKHNKAIWKQMADDQIRTYDTMAVGADALAGVLSGAINQALMSNESFGAIVSKMLGNMLINMGTSLAQAAIFGGIMGLITANPVMLLAAALCGAASATMIGIGYAMVSSRGSAVSGAGGGGGARSAPTLGRDGSVLGRDGSPAATHRSASGTTDGFNRGFDTTSGPAPQVITVNFGRGMIVGTPHQTARVIKDILAGRSPA